VNRARAVALVLLAAGLAGCGLPAAPAHPRLWTLFDLDRLAKTGDVALAPDGGIPGGVPVSHFLQADGADFSLTLSDAWTEGQPAAYLTTELWSGYNEVWVQPQYVPVNGWSAEGVPQLANDPADGKVHPIFGVGPGTAFYAPYWQQIFFDVPVGASLADFRSSRQVIESGVTLHPAGAVVCPLAPPGSLGPPTHDSPLPGQPLVGSLQKLSGWVDGQPVDYVRLGAGTFRWDASRAVQELPLFTFTMHDTNGGIRRIDGAPSVGGTGPIGAGAPADVAGATVPAQPKYGALWRAYTVTVPVSARVFAPPREELTALTGLLGEANAGPTYSDAAMTGPLDAIAPWVGRVAVNPGDCFPNVGVDPANPAGNCVWLDSQRAIEREIDGEWIRRTDLLLNCPFASFNGKAVNL
jgi:hypothetical protein